MAEVIVNDIVLHTGTDFTVTFVFGRFCFKFTQRSFKIIVLVLNLEGMKLLIKQKIFQLTLQQTEPLEE